MIYYKFDYEPLGFSKNGNQIKLTYVLYPDCFKGHGLADIKSIMFKRLIIKNNKVRVIAVEYNYGFHSENMEITLVVEIENAPKGEIKEYHTYGGTIHYYA